MKTPMPESLFQQSCRPHACNFIKKETLAQVFSGEYCEISKNTFSYKTHPVAASVTLFRKSRGNKSFPL